MKYAIGIDIGGTKVASGIVSEKGDLIQQEKVDSDPSNRENMFEQVVTCVKRLMKHSSIPMSDIYGIGAGVPGKVNRKKGIAVFQNNLPWSDFPLAERIKEVFNINRVIIDNDVYMGTFGEWKAARLTNDDLFVYMTVSTGISSAIIQGGEFIRGAGFAGEIGLVPVYVKNSEMPFMRLEQTASGLALSRHANKQYGKQNLSGKEVFEAYYNGDATAQNLVDDLTQALSQGIYMISSLLDPHQIILGGSVVVNNPDLIKLIKTKLDTWLINEQKHILDNIASSRLGSEQGIIGAGRRILEN